MHELARAVPARLLERGARAGTRDNARAVSLAFTHRSLPRYFQLPSRDEKDAVHGVLNDAERATRSSAPCALVRSAEGRRDARALGALQIHTWKGCRRRRRASRCF